MVIACIVQSRAASKLKSIAVVTKCMQPDMSNTKLLHIS